ncbi:MULTISPECIES: hypothetical protein [unclassified Phenylobacterium]|uniref:hypothetical protein n=1 Tax=unclassified Phenylobacterium TaxID=2640670 RepID=UPI00083A5CA5|nr:MULTISPECIES: hypothetical protein [unclassified Phenylobacterium]
MCSLFSVRPLRSGGWRLQGDEMETVVFNRGGHAERQARALAQGVARLGRDAKVNVYDAGDRLVGSIRYYGCPEPPGPAMRARYPWAS